MYCEHADRFKAPPGLAEGMGLNAEEAAAAAKQAGGASEAGAPGGEDNQEEEGAAGGRKGGKGAAGGAKRKRGAKAANEMLFGEWEVALLVYIFTGFLCRGALQKCAAYGR